jgi:hypothetical protein
MKRLTTLVLIVLLISTALAQTPTTGSWSLLHTQTARTFEQGRLEVYTDLNFYTKLGDFIGSPPSNFAAVNYWVAASDIFTTYGIIDNLDMSLGLRLYQDTNISDANIPDDLFFTLKAGSFTLGTRNLYGAAMLNFRFPTGKQPNYALAEYSSGAVEFGAMGALSYYVDPYLLNRNFSAHLNLGWYTHNDAGKIVDARDRKPGLNASKLQYGLGLVYPVGLIDLMLEVSGITWIDQPDSMVLGREESKPPWRPPTFSLPNYPDWKAWLALNFTILPLSPAERTPEELERERFNNRVDFFQNIIEERQRIENVQEELERLKREREEAEKELEELKQILEEEG